MSTGYGQKRERYRDQEEALPRLNDARMAWIVALAALVLASVGGLITATTRASALEVRMGNVEKKQSDTDSDMKKVLDSLARIEQKVSDIGK